MLRHVISEETRSQKLRKSPSLMHPFLDTLVFASQADELKCSQLAGALCLEGSKVYFLRACGLPCSVPHSVLTAL